MEELRVLLDQFYLHPMDDASRRMLQKQLLGFLGNDAGLVTALEVLQYVGPSAEGERLCFFAALILEDFARRMYMSATDTRKTAVRDAIVTRIGRMNPQESSLVRDKLARALVEWETRRWIHNQQPEGEAGQGQLVEMIFRFCAAPDLRSAGLTIASVLIEQGLQRTRIDVLSSQQAKLTNIIKGHIHPLQQIFQLGLLGDPELPVNLSASLTRTLEIVSQLGSISQATWSLNLLMEVSIRRATDRVSCAALSTLVDSTSLPQRHVCDHGGMDSILNHANQLVKVLAGLSFSAEEEYTTLSIAYLGLVISKNILKWTTSPTYSVGLQQLLTELLKLTSSAPRTAEDGKFFLDILDAWLLIIDSVQDRMSEGSTNAAATVAYLEQGLAAVAQACVELSLYMSNGKMLHRMEDWDSFELDLDKKLSQESDVVYETDGFFRVETEESCLSDRAALIEKCIQVASGISQLYSQSVASSLGQFLRERLRSFNRMCPEDGRTILSMTAQVGATLPASSDIARLLFQDVSELATQWNVRDLLSSSLFHILNAMLSVLENAPSDVSLSFAERLAKRAVEVILDPECMTTTRVSAASFLAKLADRFRRSVLLLGLAIPASFVRDCKQPRVARSLLVALMYTRLLGNPEASQEEWLQRIEDFRSCLDEILGRYNEVVRSNKLVVSGQEDEAALLEIVRASGLCRALYDTMMGEKASSRDALWESSKKHMQQDGVRALKIVGVLGEGIPAFAILRMFATCLPMTRNQGDFSKSILDISLSALSSVSEGVQSEAFIRVTRALLEVVRVELSDGSPSSKEWLIGAATNLVCMTLDSSVESEIKMAALDVTKECIVRHWRWFFPADTAQARLGANSLSSDPEKEEKFLGLMRSLIGALDTVDTTAYRSTLEALQYAQTSRRLFERPILHSSGALEALIIQFLRISLANRHPTLLEENASFLHSLAIAAPYSVFLERYLPQSLTQSIPLSRPQIQAAMENLPPATKSPPDLNEFSRAYSRFRDDIEYYLNLDRPLLG